MGFAIVFLGGGIGAMFRYLLNLAVLPSPESDFPYVTFAINVLGSGLMGGIAGYFAFRGTLPQHLRLFLTTGILGGFTTFSAFSLETVQLVQAERPAVAALYVVASITLGILALVSALRLARVTLGDNESPGFTPAAERLVPHAKPKLIAGGVLAVVAAIPIGMLLWRGGPFETPQAAANKTSAPYAPLANASANGEQAAASRDGARLPATAASEQGLSEKHAASVDAPTYTVAAGDTLASIAKDHYGEASRWRDIAAANPRLDPRRLRIGQRIALPSSKTN
jgi:CrcB protein